jgi:hypothetical protein
VQCACSYSWDYIIESILLLFFYCFLLSFRLLPIKSCQKLTNDHLKLRLIITYSFTSGLPWMFIYSINEKKLFLREKKNLHNNEKAKHHKKTWAALNFFYENSLQQKSSLIYTHQIKCNELAHAQRKLNESIYRYSRFFSVISIFYWSIYLSSSNYM